MENGECICVQFVVPSKTLSCIIAHIPLEAIKRIRRSKIKQEYITSS